MRSCRFRGSLGFFRSLVLAPIWLAALAVPLFAIGNAGAALILHSDPDVGGFVADSAEFAMPPFPFPPTEFISFKTDVDGEPMPGEEGAFDGGIFSHAVVLSSPDAPDATPPRSASNILFSPGSPGANPGQEAVGPSPGFKGLLWISFLPPYATAVGIGLVDFEEAGDITVYDPGGEELCAGETCTFSDSAGRYTFIGFTADSGDLIARVELEHPDDPLVAFTIQDLQFVPEPGAGVQALASIATLWLIASTACRSGRRTRLRGWRRAS